MSAAKQEKQQILVHCWTGFGHLGDEAILAGLLSSLRERFQVTAVSERPDWTQRIHGIEAIRRLPRLSWKGVLLCLARHRDVRTYIRTVRRSDLCLLGGGGLFVDLHSVEDWTQELRIPQALGKPTAVVGVGIDKLGPDAVRSLLPVLRKAKAVCLRDSYSQRDLNSWDSRIRPTLTADLAFLLESMNRPQDRQTVALIVREHPGFTDKLKSILKATIPELPVDAILMPMQKSWFCDDEALSEAIARGTRPASELVSYRPDVNAYRKQLNHSKLAISMRMHGIILAALQGIPSIAIVCHPKVGIIQQQLGMEEFCIPLEDLSLKTLSDKVRVLLENYDQCIQRLERACRVLKSKAEKNIDSVVRLVSSASSLQNP